MCWLLQKEADFEVIAFWRVWVYDLLTWGSLSFMIYLGAVYCKTLYPTWCNLMIYLFLFASSFCSPIFSFLASSVTLASLACSLLLVYASFFLVFVSLFSFLSSFFWLLFVARNWLTQHNFLTLTNWKSMKQKKRKQREEMDRRKRERWRKNEKQRRNFGKVVLFFLFSVSVWLSFCQNPPPSPKKIKKNWEARDSGNVTCRGAVEVGVGHGNTTKETPPKKTTKKTIKNIGRS